MSGPFRNMPDVLGESERESAAIQDFGRWRARTKTIVLLAFALLGLLPAGLGYWFTQEAQFRLNDGVASLYINVGGAAIPWFLMFMIGAWVGRRVVLGRTPAKLAKLAVDYEISVEQLAGTTNLVSDL